MNSRQFAKDWLTKEGLFDKDSDYEGWLGNMTMATVECIAAQGHSGGSMFRMLELLKALYDAYDNHDHPLWHAYWQSDEGQKLIAAAGKG